MTEKYVKPDRETVIEAMSAALHVTTDRIPGLNPGPVLSADGASVVVAADAALNMWPGRSEAVVKAEALREFRRGFGRSFALQDPYGHFDTETMSACHRQVEELLDAQADRIEKGETR